MNKFNLVIIGAGPAGLYAGFYAGLRHIKTLIVDVSTQIGGQPANVFGAKYVYDMPGIHKITGNQLISNLVDQVTSQKEFVSIKLKTHIKSLLSNPNQKDEYLIDFSDGTQCEAQAVIFATGNGGFNPIRLLASQFDHFENIHYLIKEEETYKNKKIVVLGGGDSALD
jgi:thioredoxin reductase (NADPH)